MRHPELKETLVCPPIYSMDLNDLLCKGVVLHR
jgi:hypothetical protein